MRREISPGNLIVAATANRGKLAELNALLSPQWQVRAQADFGFDGLGDEGETACTFVENALLKARHACAATGLPAIADDSGLEVDALAGAPGIHSAYYAGMGATDAANIAKLLRELEAAGATSPAERIARFHCVLVFMYAADDPSPRISHGVWQGRIGDAPAGENGFGYDPIFYPDGLNITSAQLSPSQKNRLSHRGRALRQLRKLL